MKTAKGQRESQQKGSSIFGSSKKPVDFLPSGCLNDSEPEGLVLVRPAASLAQATLQASHTSGAGPAPQSGSGHQSDVNGHLEVVAGFGGSSEGSPATQLTGPQTQPPSVQALVGAKSSELCSEDLSGRGGATSPGLGFDLKLTPGLPERTQLQSGAVQASSQRPSLLVQPEGLDREAALLETSMPTIGTVLAGVPPQPILRSGAFTTEFGCLSVVEDREQHDEPNELEGEFFQNDTGLPLLCTSKLSLCSQSIKHQS